MSMKGSSFKKMSLKENQFYDDFEDIKRFEKQMTSKRLTGSSG